MTTTVVIIPQQAYIPVSPLGIDMLEFEQFSVEVMEQGFSTVLIDCSSFEKAETKAKRLTNRHPCRMVNIIAWDSSKRHSQSEWALVKQQYATPYEPSETLH
jgi:hypothetical protein